MGYSSSQAADVGYSHKFTSSASGTASFDGSQTMHRPSKANEGDIDRAFSEGSDPAPF
jgi:replicative DNA helicase